MKKVLLIPALLIAGAFTAQAQDDFSASPRKRLEEDMHLGVGIRGGWNMANMTIDNAGDVSDKRMLNSWNAGVYLDAPLCPFLSIQPGLFVSGKGSKYNILGTSGSENYTEVKRNPIYLELPVNAVVKAPIAPGIHLFVGAGPYVAMGIAGNNTTEGMNLGASFSNSSSITYSNDNPATGSNGNTFDGNMKRWDFGLNGLAGIEIRHLTLSANYGLGLVNVQPGANNTNNYKYENRVFSLNVGFQF